MNTPINHRVWQRLFSRSAVAAWLAAFAWQAAAALEVGSSVPQVKLPTATGVVDLEKLKGRVLYVDFWASWCGPCKQSFPWMNEMHAKYAAKGLEIIAINVDAKAADAERFLATTPAKFTVAFDAKGITPKQFDVKAMPTSYLVDSVGKVTLVHAGFRDSDRVSLEAAINAALDGRQTQGRK